MAVQIPLNHFVTDLSEPDKTSFDVLQGNISSLKLKSMAYSALEKICYVALLALIATVFAVSYNLLVLSGAAPLLMAGMILVSPLLVIAPAKFSQLSNYYSHMAESENRVYNQMRQIENWGTPQIEEFMRNQQLNPALANRAALAQVNREEPLKALIPLIARYQVMEDRITELRRRYREAPAQLEAGFREKEAQTGKEIPAAEKQKIRFESQSLNWAYMEMEAIPLSINAATLLQLIENPSMVDLDVLPMSFIVPNVGSCLPRNYAERMFGKQVQPGNDDYFIFHPDLHRPALSHQQFEDAEMSPRLVRGLLYPRV